MLMNAFPGLGPGNNGLASSEAGRLGGQPSNQFTINVESLRDFCSIVEGLMLKACI